MSLYPRVKLHLRESIPPHFAPKWQL